MAQYTGVNWRTGTVFDSSWQRSLPYSFKIGRDPEPGHTGLGPGTRGRRPSAAGSCWSSRRRRLRPCRPVAGRHQGHGHPRLRRGHHQCREPRLRRQADRKGRGGSGAGGGRGRHCTGPGHRQTGRARHAASRPVARLVWVAGFTAAAVALFAAYIRLSATYPVNSDGANIVLMSSDMLHGNLLLHGWWMSDVSFYTTELPEYVLIGAIRGHQPRRDAHRGRADLHAGAGAHGPAGQGTSAGQSGEGAAARPGDRGRDHAGAAAWRGHLRPAAVGRAHRHRGAHPGRLADAGPGRAPRWYVPVIAGVVLAWAMVADSLVLVAAIVPLALVATARASAGPRTALRAAWYELSLAGAASPRPASRGWRSRPSAPPAATPSTRSRSA